MKDNSCRELDQDQQPGPYVFDISDIVVIQQVRADAFGTQNFNDFYQDNDGKTDGQVIMPAFVYYLLVKSINQDHEEDQLQQIIGIVGLISPFDEFYFIGKGLEAISSGINGISKLSKVKAILRNRKIKIASSKKFKGKSFDEFSQGKVDEFVEVVEDVSKSAGGGLDDIVSGLSNELSDLVTQLNKIDGVALTKTDDIIEIRKADVLLGKIKNGKLQNKTHLDYTDVELVEKVGDYRIVKRGNELGFERGNVANFESGNSYRVIRDKNGSLIIRAEKVDPSGKSKMLKLGNGSINESGQLNTVLSVVDVSTGKRFIEKSRGFEVLQAIIEAEKTAGKTFKTFKSTWTKALPDNLNEFNKGVSEGLSFSEAAKKTWSGSQMKRYGLTDATDIVVVPQGATKPPFQSVTVVFKKGSKITEGRWKNVQKIKNKFPNEAMPTDGKLWGVAEIEGGIIKPIGNKGNTFQEVDFVVTVSGDLKIGKKHHFLGNAGDVEAAGRIKIVKGKVKKISNASGHYFPSVTEAENYPKILRQLGIDTKGASLEILYEDPSGALKSLTKFIKE